MLTRLKNWLLGYLSISIRGTAPERFINLCCHRKLYIWNLTKNDDIYRFDISLKSYKNIKPVIKKTGLRPKILKKHGLPFLIHRYRKRTGFFIGLLLCCILVYLMSLYIWDIQISGGRKYTPEALLEYLEDTGIKAGVMKKRIDCSKIEEGIRLTYNDIGWVSAEIKGTQLIIKITETDMPAPIIEAERPSHMIAAKDAVIKSIITRTGTPLVKPGDVVRKGDIIVSGIVDVKDDFDVVIEKKPVIASANIRCSSYYDYYDSFPMERPVKVYSGRTKKRYCITILGNKIFLYKPRYSYNEYDIIVNEYNLHITDTFYLPFSYSSVLVREYEEESRRYNDEEAINLAGEKLRRYFDCLAEKEVKIIESNVAISIEGDRCIAKGRIFVEEPAWEYRAVDESEWRTEQADEPD